MSSGVMSTCDTKWSLTLSCVTINQYHKSHREQATHAICVEHTGLTVGIETARFDIKDGHIILIIKEYNFIGKKFPIKI